MKLLLVLSSDDTYNNISLCVKPLGFELVRYYHALKAMDNIDEVDPNAIIISAVDFPRHWKAMVQFFRNERPKEACPIILLKGPNFRHEDISKASFIGVSGTIMEALDNPTEKDRLQGILSRYLPVEEKRRSRRYHVQPGQKYGLVFNHPKSSLLITGLIKDISTGGLSFFPDNSSLMRDIGLNAKLENCSFRAGDFILSPVCRLARTGRIVSMEFLYFPDGEQKTLDLSIKKLLHGELGSF
jgi:hypothetical protein